MKLWCENREGWIIDEPFNVTTGFIFNIVAFFIDSQQMRVVNHFLGISTVLFHAYPTTITHSIDQFSIMLLIYVYILEALDMRIQLDARYLAVPCLVYVMPFQITMAFLWFIGLSAGMYISPLDMTPNLVFLTMGGLWMIDKVCAYGIHTHWLFHLLSGYLSVYMARLILDTPVEERCKFLDVRRRLANHG